MEMEIFNNKTQQISKVVEPVQRVVHIREKIDSVFERLKKNGKVFELSVDEYRICGRMLGLSHRWDFGSDDELISFVHKVDSFTKLINSVLNNGILSKSRLKQDNISYVGSQDRDLEGQLAVNVLDIRPDENKSKSEIKDIADSVATDSLAAKHRGSISVALERAEDHIKKEINEAADNFSKELDRKPESVPVPEGIPEDYEQLYISMAKENMVREYKNELLQKSYAAELSDRAMSTMMAIIPYPDFAGPPYENSMTYESTVPSGQINIGDGGIKRLLIPEWYRPFYSMIQAPNIDDVEVVFVGNTEMTVYYKFNGDMPVKIPVPDYKDEIAAILNEIPLMATHILKI